MKKTDVTEYTVVSSKFHKEFRGFRFVFLSDLHSNVYKINLHGVNDVIRSTKPDAILITGDMFNSILKDDIEDTMNYITVLAKYYPVFYSLGNHEYRMKLFPEKYGDRFRQIYCRLSDAGVCFLSDDTVYLEKEHETIALTGLEIDLAFYNFMPPVMGKGLIPKHIGEADRSLFNLLMAHNPEYFSNYAAWGADLTLSGHAHGGIIRLPGLGGVISTTKKIFPKYCDGMHCNRSGNKLIISRGLGTHTVNMRINNRPEIVILKILAKN